MANDYRVYRLDRANHVVEVEWLTAGGDDEAIAIARAMKTAGKRELWQGERLVATVHVTAVEEPSAAIWL